MSKTAESINNGEDKPSSLRTRTLSSVQDLKDYFSCPPITIVGFGSLMSPTSSRNTFPNLKNFKVVRVEGYRRLFRHPAAIFFERGIAELENLRISSLCTEKSPGNSFLAVAFTLDAETVDAFLKREEEFSFDICRYKSLQDSTDSTECGLMCTASSDEVYISRWGREAYEKNYLSRGLHSIWNWDEDSGILPCSIYLRHCYLSAKHMSTEVLDSFLDDTFLVDRTTTIRQYLGKNPDILEMQPPECLVGRYSG